VESCVWNHLSCTMCTRTGTNLPCPVIAGFDFAVLPLALIGFNPVQDKRQNASKSVDNFQRI
jgi:hypothetical protein